MDSIRKQQSELHSKLEHLFASAQGEVFEDGMESAFSRGLVATIEAHRHTAIDALYEIIAAGGFLPVVVSEALRWVGHIEDPATHQARLILLERSLNHSSADVRDGAALAIASMDDPASIRYVQEAIRRETVPQLRKNMQQVLDQLIETQTEQSSLATMLASEAVLRKDWDTPEEDAVWSHL
jgi:hypothetical protein